MEAQLLPSAGESKNDPKVSALKLQESILDIVGDEQADLVKQHRLMRWDKSKRKYVQTTIGAEVRVTFYFLCLHLNSFLNLLQTSGISKSKKLRLESGQLVQKKDVKLGELYEKWQKKNNGGSIGRTGVFDEADDMDSGSGNTAALIKGKHDKRQPAGNKAEIFKTSSQIQKERNKKADDKIKNMKRKDRRELESRKGAKSQIKKGDIGKKQGKIWSTKSRRK